MAIGDARRRADALAGWREQSYYRRAAVLRAVWDATVRAELDRGDLGRVAGADLSWSAVRRALRMRGDHPAPWIALPRPWQERVIGALDELATRRSPRGSGVATATLYARAYLAGWMRQEGGADG